MSGSTAGPSAWIRFTERLRLEPIGPEHAGDLWRLHQDEAVAAGTPAAGPRGWRRNWRLPTVRHGRPMGSANGWLTIAAPAGWWVVAGCPGGTSAGGAGRGAAGRGAGAWGGVGT